MNDIIYWIKNRLRWNFWLGWAQARMSRFMVSTIGGMAVTSELSAVLFRLTPGDLEAYEALMQEGFFDLAEQFYKRHAMPTNLGVLGYRSVTTAFVNFVVDQLQTETSVFGDYKFHDSGVGVTAEAIGDTAMETTDGEARATGSQTESAANAYRSVGTISYTTTKAITEHGLFNDVAAGTLMDRTVFSAVNVVNGDSIQFTYTLTISAGG